MSTISFHLNGTPISVDAEPHESLRTVLRRLGMISVKYGSATGETGAAAVLLDGRLVSSDVVLAMQADGHSRHHRRGAERQPRPAPDPDRVRRHRSIPVRLLGGGDGARHDGPARTRSRSVRRGDPRHVVGHPRPRDRLREAGRSGPSGGRRAARRRRSNRSPRSMLPPMTDGTNPVDVDPDDPPVRLLATPCRASCRRSTCRRWPSSASQRSRSTRVKLAKGNPAFTDDIELRGMLYAKVLLQPARPRPHRRHRRHGGACRCPACTRCCTTRTRRGSSTPPVASRGRTRTRTTRSASTTRCATSAIVSPPSPPSRSRSPRQAMRLIDVTYEVLPAVFDELEAIEPGAPVIHDEADTDDIFDRDRNIVHQLRAPTAATSTRRSRRAHQVFEGTFRVHQVQQVPIEPHISIAWLDADERHGRAHGDPGAVPHPTHAGAADRDGGQGHPRHQAPHRRRVRRQAGDADRGHRRPPRDRDPPAGPARTHPRGGVLGQPHPPPADDHVPLGCRRRRQPRGAAHEGRSATPAPTAPTATRCRRSAGCAGSRSYNCPNKRFDCDVAYTNIPVPGAYRGYGAPQAAFALEAHMEDIARATRSRPARVQAPELGQARRRAEHRPPHRRAGDRRTTSMLDEYPKVISTGIEECVAQGQAGDRLAPPPRPGVAPAGRPPDTSGAGSGSRSACTARASRSSTWAGAASSSTTTARSTC